MQNQMPNPPQLKLVIPLSDESCYQSDTCA